ncbi:MAG: oligoendopeptidase F [Bacteroidia bacterium]|nr:MAG: oligoendopeptidase F [Bacteroidia bacterium]
MNYNSLSFENWDDLKPHFDELLQRNIENYHDYLQFIYDWNALLTVISEEGGWRYINMTCHTNDESLKQKYLQFVTQIEPHLQIVQNQLNRKTFESPFFKSLSTDYFSVFKKNLQKDIELFREENVPLFTQIQELQQKYAETTGQQSIEYEGKTLTLQQASIYLKNLNRTVRKEVYYLINNRRQQDKDALNNLLTDLIQLRHKVAINAGFRNFRDYMHQALGRYDYSVQDCKQFHQSVENAVVPVVQEIHAIRQKKLHLENDYYPWDTQVDMYGLQPLKPFETEEEFISKSIQCFQQIDGFFADCLKEMHQQKHLDLSSRIGKAPGGYQYPLYKTGVPFIFMNAVGLHRDLVTLMHETGHAVHFFLNNHYPVLDFKSPPSEVAELASMSMELITMEHWDVFFPEKKDLQRAKQQQLESVIDALPWIAAIDKFQHLLYENPDHNIEERYTYWMDTIQSFSPKNIKHDGLEAFLKIRWQAQLHIYEVPFYYIEYGFAQLGAIAMWKQYKENPSRAIENYKNALSLGNTKSIPEIYQAAGIRFDFSESYIKELIDFVWKEYEKCLF